MKARLALCTVLVFPPALSLGAGEPLTVRISPAISVAPANVTVRATVEADDANRAIEVTADSSDFYRSSVIPLDGARAPHVNQFEFRGLPGGQYDIIETLIDVDGRPRITLRQQVQVIASGER